jgi:hypothetical protein
MATSTSPIPPPPRLKSAEEKLEKGLREQEALTAKEKARQKSEKKDKKRKREDGDVEKDASGIEDATSGKDEKERERGSTGSDVTPTVFKAGKGGKDNKRMEEGGADGGMEKGGSVEEASRRCENSDTADAASPKNKKWKTTAGNTATESADNGKASWLITPSAKNGAVPLDFDTAMRAWKHREKEKRNARKARKSTSKEPWKEGSSFTPTLQEAPTITHDKEENQTATNKSKTKATAAPNSLKEKSTAPEILKMEFNQNASQDASQEPREHLLASPENFHLEAMAATQKISEGLVTSKPKSKKAPARITKPDPKIKSELLLQTILKGRQSAGSPKSGPSIKPTAFTKSKSSSIPAGKGAKEFPAKQPKAEKSRKSQTKKQVQDEDWINQTPKPQESLSQIVELSKISSKSKLQDIFDRAPRAPAEQLDFFHDEPLRGKKERMLATAAWPPTNPTNLVRPFPFYPSINITKSVAADKRHEKAAALEGWEKSFGKVQGIVGAHPDEDPEESKLSTSCSILIINLQLMLIIWLFPDIAFSSSYISSRPTGVQIRDLAFNILSLRPGEELKFKLDKRYSLTICSVASGRVEVALGKLDFGITEGGMWRIKSKEYCVIKNEREKVAVLHVTAMP